MAKIIFGSKSIAKIFKDEDPVYKIIYNMISRKKFAIKVDLYILF